MTDKEQVILKLLGVSLTSRSMTNNTVVNSSSSFLDEEEIDNDNDYYDGSYSSYLNDFNLLKAENN